MKVSVCEIAWLYMREKTLRALAVFFFGSVLLTSNPGVLVQMCASRAFMTAFQSAIIMLGLWMTFLIGIILKRQLASYRASLLPGYRWAHALVFAFILGALVMTGLVWSSYLALLFHVGFDDHLAVVAAAIFVSVISIVLGYLSVAWLVFFSFIIFCLFSDPVYMAVGGAFGFTPSNMLTIVIAVIVLAVFFKRFWDVMEESWEYPYLFSWSEKFNSAGRNANWAAAARALVVLRKIFGFKKDILVKSSYSQARGLFAKAMHWECLKWENYKLGLVLLAILTPLYVLYIHLVPGHFAVFLKGHLKYFLLGVYPVVVSVGLNQKSVLHWGYELTRPVGREEFIRQKGTGMLLEISLFWLLALVFVLIIPYAVVDAAQLLTVRFWAQMMLTLTFALTVFGWIASLRGASSGRTVLSLACLGGLSGYQFYILSSVSLTGLVAGTVVWLAMGVVLCGIACRRWMNAEIN